MWGNQPVNKIADIIDAFQPNDSSPPNTLFSFVRWALKGAFPYLFMAACLSAIVGALEIITALLLGRVIDSAVSSDPSLYIQENWWLIAAFFAFFLLLRPMFIGIAAFSNSLIVQPNVTPLVLSRLHRWTLGQSVTFFDNDFAGRIAQKQMQTASALAGVMNELISVGAFAVATLIGAIFFLISIDIRIAVVLALWLCLYFAVLIWFLPRIRKRAKERAGARATVTGQIVDTVTNIKTVKLFAHSDHEDQAALSSMRAFRRKAIHFGTLSAWFRFCLMGVAGLLPILLIGGTLLLWRNGGASEGDIAAAGSIAIRIGQMTGWVSFALMAIYAQIGEIEDGMRTLTAPHDLVDGGGALDLKVHEGKVDFDSVSFAYGREAGGIHNVSLSISPMEKIGIVGASGAGKSTLVALLLRLYDAEKGAVLIDGQNVSHVNQESLRAQIGMVTQETAMFNRSALDNIGYGKPNATEAEVIKAAKQAEAHDFILGLEDHTGRTGYAAFLGERGVKLSGGQRQRIALVRAILKNAPILVLDEATSALDSEVEASIQDALIGFMADKTVFAVAHRLSTISQMDRIIVLDGGQIVEQGTHAELLDKGGLYASYWNRQSGGFIGVHDAAE